MRGLARDIYAHRELLSILVARNLKIRYKNSALGFFWTLLGPLFMIAIYWLFLEILKIEIAIESLVVGIVVWQFLAMSVGDSLHAILGNANLVTKTAFPRAILPLSTVVANLVNFLLSFVALAVFLLLMRVDFGALQWLPLILATHFALCLGLSLMVSSLNVFFRDLEHLVQVVMLAWFFVSPVMYTISFIQERYQDDLQYLYFLNPMAGIVTAYRNVLLSVDLRTDLILTAPFAACWVVLGAGVIVFSSLEQRFGDEL